MAVVPWAPTFAKRYRLASARAVPTTAKCSAQTSANVIKVTCMVGSRPLRTS